MLKILHIVSGDLWAGAEVQAFTLLKALKPRCDVMVVLMNEGRLADELRAAGIATQVINESNTPAFGIVLALRKILKAYRPDVVHTHRQKENVLGSLANLLSVRKVSVRTVHGSSEFELKGLKKCQGRVDDLIGRYVQQGAIAVSRSLYGELIERFGPDKVVVIPNGIDGAALYQNAKPIPLSQDHSTYWHIGLIGRLEPVKRVDLFLQIARSLLHDRPAGKTMMFHIIGGGSLKEQLEMESKKLGLSGRIFFHGHRNDIASCILSLDALVICSDHEGTPMTGLEALAMGKPVIAHKVGGLVEMLEHYPDFLVTEQSPQSYRQALLSLFGSPNYEEVRLPEIFTAKINAETTLSFYRKLLADADPHS